jgi:hypothetical protein
MSSTACLAAAITGAIPALARRGRFSNSQDVDARYSQHPNDEPEGDSRHNDIANPCPERPWLGSVSHLRSINPEAEHSLAVSAPDCIFSRRKP